MPKMDANSPTRPLLRVGSFSRPREKAGDESAAHRADPLGSFSRTREKAGDEGATRPADPHPNPLPRAGEGAGPDPLVLYGEAFTSRLLLGTSRYPSPAVLHAAVQRAQPAMLTASLRREGAGSNEGNGGRSFWQLLQTLGVPVLPNTAGCHSAEEVFTTAQMAREVFGTPWIKLELIGDDYSLQPDTLNLVEAARRLILDGFKVLPYCTEDLVLCQRLVDAGCQAVMPWAAPIGTGKGPVNPYAMRLLRERLSVPLIVDAGLGLPSHACQVMEWGFDAVLLNTAVALAQDPVAMAGAFADAVRAGRSAFLAGAMREQDAAQPSTPVLGTPFWHEA